MFLNFLFRQLLQFKRLKFLFQLTKKTFECLSISLNKQTLTARLALTNGVYLCTLFLMSFRFAIFYNKHDYDIIRRYINLNLIEKLNESASRMVYFL